MNLLKRSRFYATLFSAAVLNLKPIVSLRGLCGPAMNCHGCPWSTTACPVGVVSFSSAMHTLPALAIGVVLAIGILFGRLVCAFVCPFGLFQDLLHRIPGPKLRLPRWWRYGKYAALALLVLLLPFALGFSVEGFLAFDKPKVEKAGSDITVVVTVRNPSPEPVHGVTCDLVWRSQAVPPAELQRLPQSFPDLTIEPGGELALPVITIPNRLAEADLGIDSKLAVVRQDPGLHYYCTTCPVGTLEAVVLPALSNGQTPNAYASHNALRLGILVAFLVLMWLSSRPFCRGFCPLGAFYGLTARFAVVRMGVDHSQCIGCGECNSVCPAELDVPKEVGGPECIACGDCMATCPQNGITRRYGLPGSTRQV